MWATLKSFLIPNTHDHSVATRRLYGIRSGIIGISINILLFISKLTIGTFSHSIAIINDAYNNLSDMASAVVALLGIRMGTKPADVDHPQGHGRSEYIASLIISFLILGVAVQLISEAVQGIQTPSTIVLQPFVIVVLVLSILFKLAMFLLNRTLGIRLHSLPHQATAQDSLNDVLITFSVLVTMLISHLIDFPIDGILGLIIGSFILFSGYRIASQSIHRLLGSSIDQSQHDKIIEIIEKNPTILGYHDLVFHDYGPHQQMASIHAEVDEKVSIGSIHQVVDQLEETVWQRLGIHLLIHLDPLTKDVAYIERVKTEVSQMIQQIHPDLKIDHFRIAIGHQIHDVPFDLVIPKHLQPKHKNIINALKEQINLFPHYRLIPLIINER